MAVSWSSLPEDVKLIIIRPLSRIDKGSLRQCSLDDKLLIDSIFKSIREISFIANRSYIRIRYDEGFEDFFENNSGTTVAKRCENFKPFHNFTMNENFQIIAWRSFQNMLKQQNNTIDSLNMSFVGSLDFTGEWNEPERIVPDLPIDVVTVKNLEISGDCPDEIIHKIVGFVKPGIEFLNIWVKVTDLSTVSRVGGMEPIRTAKKVFSLLQLTFEQSKELEADEVVNKTKLLTDENIVELLEKSLATGKPSKFTYHRLWPNAQNIVSHFRSVTPWTQETANQFEELTNNHKFDLANKNFLLYTPARKMFIEISRFSITGFIL